MELESVAFHGCRWNSTLPCHIREKESMMRVLLLAWAALFFLVPAARGDSAGRALHVLCGPRGDAIADMVRVEARRHLIHPALLAAVVASESTCNPNAHSGHNDWGLGQIRLGGSANVGGYSAAQLRDPATNLYLTSRHLAKCLTICNGYVLGALSVYRGVSRCRATDGSRRVLGMLRTARENRS
jgi:soluble lytic murein transglycosylase-like protein